MTAVRFGLLLLLLLSPLPFGAVERWAVLAVELAAAALGAAALVQVVRDPAVLSRRARLLVGLWLGMLAVAAAQLVPLPLGVTGAVAPRTQQLRESVAPVVPPTGASAPMSLSAPDTLDAALRLAAYGLLGVAAAVAFREEKHLRRLAAVLACSAVFQALYGSAEYLSGHNHIFAYAKKHMLDAATGTFINRNHVAAYLALCLPFAIALAMPRTHVRDRRGLITRLADLEHGDTRARIAAVLAAVAIWSGILLSFSRAGIALGLMATVLVPIVSGTGRRRILVAAAALLVPLSVVLLWQDVRLPAERLIGPEAADIASEARFPVWAATADLAAAYPAMGSGLGTFRSLFAIHQPPGVIGRWDHAHNDWLQGALEGGIPMLFLGVAALAVSAAALYAVARRGGRRASLSAAAGTAVGCAALGALVDFGLRIPAIAILAVIAAAVLAANVPPAESRARAAAVPRAARGGRHP